MKAEVISIGTELLLGEISDTNASFIASELARLGIDCYFISQVGDNLERMVETLLRGLDRSDVVITTGGLGPTKDDLTRESIAVALGEVAVVVQDQAERLATFFARRGIMMPDSNLKQAWLIPSAQFLPNPVGTAPGWYVTAKRNSADRLIISMPGVPYEMKRMWKDQVFPRLQGLSGMVIQSRTLKILGVGESVVESRIADLMESSNPTVAPYAKRDGVHLRIAAKAVDLQRAGALIAPVEREIRERLGAFVAATDAEDPYDTAIATMESRGLDVILIEVGKAARGALSTKFAESKHCRASLYCKDWRAVASISQIADDSSATGDEDQVRVVKALMDRAGANFALVASAFSSEVSEGPGLLDLDVDTSILLSGSGGLGASSRHNAWRTEQSEVGRLVSLAALSHLADFMAAEGSP